jgi:hypothetical protein
LAGWLGSGRGRPWNTRGARADLAGELVASPRNRPDEVAICAEGFAQRGNSALPGVFLDDPASPDAAHQLVLADDSPCRLDQHHQHVEIASAEFDRPVVGEKLAAPRHDWFATFHSVIYLGWC